MMGFDDPLHKASDDEKFGAPVGVFFYILDENTPGRLVRRACEYTE